MTFEDKKNDLKAEITFGKVKKRYNVVNLDLLTISNLQSTAKARKYAVSMEHTVVT
jgi:hypothetical protein